MADALGSVMTLDDIQAMKVADLRKELKARGLSISGNKTELIERLQEAVDVPKLDNSGSEDQIVSECLEGLENLDGADEVNEDEVLSDDVLYSEENKVNESQEINEEEILAPSSQPEAVIPVKSAVKLHRKPLPVLEETEQLNLEADNVKQSQVKEGENNHLTLVDSEKKVVSTSTKSMTQEERMALRAKKFSNGTPDKLKVRAARFGADDNAVKAVAEKVASSIEEKTKLLKRKERFGTTVTANSTVQNEEKNKLLKRKERFGTSLAADSSEQGKPKYQKQATLQQALKKVIHYTAKAHSSIENPLPCTSSAPDVQVPVPADHGDPADPEVLLM